MYQGEANSRHCQSDMSSQRLLDDLVLLIDDIDGMILMYQRFYHSSAKLIDGNDRSLHPAETSIQLIDSVEGNLPNDHRRWIRSILLFIFSATRLFPLRTELLFCVLQILSVFRGAVIEFRETLSMCVGETIYCKAQEYQFNQRCAYLLLCRPDKEIDTFTNVDGFRKQREEEEVNLPIDQ
jgi:hypothetical protein